MAYQLAMLVDCNDVGHCKLLKRLLDRQTRPVFPEDVAETHRPMFSIIGAIDYPDESELLPEGLWFCWNQTEGFGQPELLELLDSVGIVAKFVFEVPDSPLSGDDSDDEEYGRYWLRQSDDYVRVERELIVQSFAELVTQRLPN